MEDSLRETVYSEYVEAWKIHEKPSPEEKPFENQYAALKKLEKIHASLEEEISDEGIIMKASLEHFIGKIHYTSEDRPSAVQSLQKSLRTLEANLFDNRALAIFMKATNDLAIIYCEREEYSSSYALLKEGEKVYEEIGEKSIPLSSIWDSWEILKPGNERNTADGRKDAFEEVYTHTLFYLSQTCQNLGKVGESSDYCGRCLHRQLRTISSKEDFQQFSLHAACLGQYYLTTDDYLSAKTCLLAANRIFAQVDTVSSDDGEFGRKIEETRNDIKRCWIKYCVAFLEWSSKKLAMRSVAAELEAIEDAQPQQSAIKFDLERFSKYEDECQNIPSKAVHVLPEANKIHKLTQKLCEKSLEFFKFDGYVMDHVEISQDLSKSWKNLAEFDTNFERRCKMHKRRIDLLTPLVAGLNPQYYLQVVRQLQYEIGEVYSEMTELKMAIANNDEVPTVHQIKKINVLANSGIKFFTGFIDSCREADKKLPKRFEKILVRPVLMAHFHVARLYGKMISPVMSDRVDWTKKSWQAYKTILMFCEQDPSAKDEIPDEYDLVVEMDALMPQKLQQLN